MTSHLSLVVDNVGMDLPIKFGDSRSTGFLDIRGADFVSNERTNIKWPIPQARNAIAFRLKMREHLSRLSCSVVTRLTEVKGISRQKADFSCCNSRIRFSN